MSNVEILDCFDLAQTCDLAINRVEFAGGLELALPGILIITGHTIGLQILMACCLGIFLTGVTPIVMVLGYESAYPVSEGTTESLMQLGANGWGLICLLAVNGIFQGNHMGTLVFFLAGTVLSLVLTMMIKEASLKERRIE